LTKARRRMIKSEKTVEVWKLIEACFKNYQEMEWKTVQVMVRKGRKGGWKTKWIKSLSKTCLVGKWSSGRIGK
jgi:hypothetical protein